MNEKRQDFNRFKEGKTEIEIFLENLIALTSSLETRARALGAYTILRELGALKKSAQKNNGNKKLVKSIQKKYKSFQRQIEELEESRKTRTK